MPKQQRGSDRPESASVEWNKVISLKLNIITVFKLSWGLFQETKRPEETNDSVQTFSQMELYYPTTALDSQTPFLQEYH